MWIPNVLHFSSGFAGNRLKIIENDVKKHEMPACVPVAKATI
jgi:hypothetical protein